MPEIAFGEYKYIRYGDAVITAFGSPLPSNLSSARLSIELPDAHVSLMFPDIFRALVVASFG